MLPADAAACKFLLAREQRFTGRSL